MDQTTPRARFAAAYRAERRVKPRPYGQTRADLIRAVLYWDLKRSPRAPWEAQFLAEAARARKLGYTATAMDAIARARRAMSTGQKSFKLENRQ